MSKDNDLINVNLTEAYLRTPARLLGYNGFQHSKGHNAQRGTTLKAGAFNTHSARILDG